MKENKSILSNGEQPVNTSNYISIISLHILAFGITFSLPWIDFRFPNCGSELSLNRVSIILSEIIDAFLSEVCFASANDTLRIPRFSGRQWDDKTRGGDWGSLLTLKRPMLVSISESEVHVGSQTTITTTNRDLHNTRCPKLIICSCSMFRHLQWVLIRATALSWVASCLMGAHETRFMWWYMEVTHAMRASCREKILAKKHPRTAGLTSSRPWSPASNFTHYRSARYSINKKLNLYEPRLGCHCTIDCIPLWHTLVIRKAPDKQSPCHPGLSM